MMKEKPVEQQTFSVYSFRDTKENKKQKTKNVTSAGLAIKIKAGKAIMIKVTATPQITGPLKRELIQLKNN